MLSPRMMKLVSMAVLSIPTLVLFSLISASCTSNSPGIKTIYLVSVSSPNYTVRAGYFGVCAGPKSSITCPGLAQLASNSTTGNSTTSDFELLRLGQEARSKVFFPWFEAAAAVLFLAAVPLALVAPFRIKTGGTWDKLVIILLGCACFLSFMATMACIPGRNGMALTADRLKGDAIVHAGLTMFILHWISFGLTFLLLMGFVVLSMPAMLLGKLKKTAAAKIGGGKGQSLESAAGNYAMEQIGGSKRSTLIKCFERFSGRYTRSHTQKQKPNPAPYPEPIPVDPNFTVGDN
ncbi:hypothetical protein FKW77_001504 [Venturia effusa]|uniref:Uncharacterized protein n=1 Tax=Venturia effusa TaxID=50376 RepID=A0A517L8M5_9PEZI|nr:hypothetical protein FKW77_001504 [Venturia effusa]